MAAFDRRSMPRYLPSLLCAAEAVFGEPVRKYLAELSDADPKASLAELSVKNTDIRPESVLQPRRVDATSLAET